MAREPIKLPPMTDKDIMPMGKHKGTEMGNVPAQYLMYMYESSMFDSFPRVKQYVIDNLDVIKQELKGG